MNNETGVAMSGMYGAAAALEAPSAALVRFS
jgi:hypothetical protein